MKVRFLGGTSYSADGSDCLAMLVETGTTRLLVECGLHVPRALAMTDVPVSAIDAVFVSHRHADHGAGLPWLLFSNIMERFYGRINEAGRLVLVIPHADESTLLAYCRDAYAPLFEPNPNVELTVTDPLSSGTVTIADELELSVFVLDHTVANHGLLCSDGRRKLAFVSDTAPVDGLESQVRGADVIVCCVAGSEQYAEVAQRFKFLTGKQAGQLARGAEAKQLCLVHVFFPEDATACREEAAEEFGRPVTLPTGGTEIKL